MSYVLWQRDDFAKRTAIASREQAQQIIADLEAFAAESFRDRSPADAMTALWRAQPGAADLYRHAQNFLLSHAPAESDPQLKEGQMPKVKKLDLGTPAEHAKLFKGAGEAAYREYCAKVSGDQRPAREAMFERVAAALVPVTKAMEAGGMTATAAANASWRVCPTAYATLRACENALTGAQAQRDEIPARIARVASIAKALASMVEKDGGTGSVEDRLMRTAAMYDWEAE